MPLRDITTHIHRRNTETQKLRKPLEINQKQKRAIFPL